MTRPATAVKTSVTVSSETLDSIDELAATFEDFVSRGEVIDMAFDYILEDERRIEKAFGAESDDTEQEPADESDQDSGEPDPKEPEAD